MFFKKFRYNIFIKKMLVALKLKSLKVPEYAIEEFFRKYQFMDLSDLDNVKEFLSSVRNMDKDYFDISIYEAIFIYYLPQMLDGAGLVAYKIK